MSITSSPNAPGDTSPEPLPAAAPVVPARASWQSHTAIVAALAAVAVFGVLAYVNRWISDDGLIVVREVRQILAGNGPNYNPFQRDEVDTSALWTWVLALAALIFRGDVAVDAVVLGIECTIAGLLFALGGCFRLHRAHGATGLLLPAGVLVPVAVSTFWDFASSGLETGLAMLWLGLSWWLLTGIGERAGTARMVATAVIIGLGPLVRPDFALVTAVFGVAGLLLRRPAWWRGLLYCAAGLAVPVGYEIFRAGYYGILEPMPGLAKEASVAFVSRGFDYLNDFVGTYQLWLPLALICVVGTRLLARSGLDRRAAVLATAPILAGLLLGAYVVWVGGDYMHGRMWVPVVFTLLLPVMLVPVPAVRSVEAVGVVLLLVWAVAAGGWARTSYQGFAFGQNGITNERSYEAAAYREPDPATSASRTRDNDLLPTLARLTAGGRILVLSGGSTANGPLWTIKLAASVPDRSGFFYDNMGITDEVVPLTGTVIDVNGLATPLAGHLQLTQRGRPGHEKWLPVAWVLAEYADPAAVAAMPATQDVTKAQVAAARHALTCGRLKDLMDSVNQPMTPGRFWHNLTGSFSRTALRIPADPVAAEREFCG
jgi:arabinofuranosyltransferase